MPEAMSSQISVKIENLDFTIPDVFSFAKGVFVESPPVGPTGSFQCKLRIYPGGGGPSTDLFNRVLSTFVFIVPPKHLKDAWSCPDVSCSMWVQGGNRTASRSLTFSFSEKSNGGGWAGFLHSPLQDFVGSNGELRAQWEVSNLPYVQPPAEPSKPLFPGLHFSMEGKMLSFCLAEGPPLFFDQRLLMARSEYFQKMLTSDEWRESRKGEVDFTGDPHVTKQIMQAILHFILSDSFEVGSVEFNLEVRKFADRFCLKSLVEKVDAAMKEMLSEDNVLQILAEMHGTDSSCVLEASCWTMLESDCSILARNEDLLDTLIAEKPTLARKLIVLGRKKRSRQS